MVAKSNSRIEQPIPLQQLVSNIGQLGALSFFQRYMRVERVALYAVDEVRQPVTLRIEVGGVNLVNIARKHNLGIFARTGNDGFHLVGRQVLRFVYNEKDV